MNWIWPTFHDILINTYVETAELVGKIHPILRIKTRLKSFQTAIEFKRNRNRFSLSTQFRAPTLNTREVTQKACHVSHQSSQSDTTACWQILLENKCNVHVEYRLFSDSKSESQIDNFKEVMVTVSFDFWFCAHKLRKYWGKKSPIIIKKSLKY